MKSSRRWLKWFGELPSAIWRQAPLPLALRYGFVLAAVAAAMGLRLVLTEWFGPGLPPYITFYPAMMAAALVGGLGPGLLATALTSLIACYWIIPPVGQFAIDSQMDRVGLVLFIGMGVFIAVFAEFYKRSRRRAAVYERELALRDSREALRRQAELIDPVRAEVIAREMQRVVRERDGADANPPPPPGAVLRRLPAVAGVVVAVAGALVLVGWLCGVDALKRIVPGLAAMTANAALGLLLAGLGLALREWRRLRLACAWIVCVVAGLTLGEYLTGWDWGIDQMLFGDRPGLFPNHPGRMAEPAALCLLMSGMALLLLKTRRGRWVQQALAFAVGVLGMVGLLDHVYGMQALYRFAGSSSMALHTAAAVVVLAVGLVVSRADGLAQVLLVPGPGNQLARRFLPVALLVPVFFGWVSELGERAGVWESLVGTSLFTLAMTLSLLASVWWIARALNRADAARREIEAQLRHQSELMDHANEALIVRDVGGVIRFWNRGAAALYGWSAAEALGRRTHELLGTRGASMAEKDAQLTHTGQWEGELAHTARDGRRVLVASRQTATAGADGRLLVLESERDITESRRLDDALRLESAALEAAANGIAIIDLAGVIQWVNPAFTQLTGYSHAEVVGHNPRVLKSGLHPPEFYRALWATVLAGEVWHGELVNKRKDGTLYPEEMTITPVRSMGGEITHFVAIKQDISARKQAEEALRLSEARWRFALDISELGAWELNLRDHTAWRSLRHDQIFGYPELLPEWTYEMALQQVVEEDKPKWENSFRRALAEHTDWSFEVRIRRADGEVRWIWAYGKSISGADGHPERMFGLVADITARKQVEEQMSQLNSELEQRVAERVSELHAKASLLAAQNAAVEQARRALEEQAAELALSSRYKSEFLANMSHELRTPLNSILIFSQLLAENASGNLSGKQVEFSNNIHASGTDLFQLINDILDLAKIESGTVTVAAEEIPFARLRDTIERNFRHVAEAKKLPLLVRFGEGLPPCMTSDPKRLQQILRNLLSNAVKFTARGQVEVRVGFVTHGWSPEHPVLGTAGRVVAFAVEDTGIGIAPDKQRLIFEAFQQADTGTSRKYGGTGLGLAISRELAVLLGGEITLASRAGQGSTFTLFLPLHFAGPTSTRSGRPSAGRPIERAHGALAAAPAEPSAEGREPRANPVQEQATGERSHRQSTEALRGRKVLVVDDDARNIFALTSLLENHEMEVICATNGRMAIELIQNTPGLSLVLMDIMMPEMDGYATMREIRRCPASSSLPILALTAKAMQGDREKCRAAGASDYIAKPVNSDQLLALMQTWVSR